MKNVNNKETVDYLLRWGYRLDHDSSFDELVHGANAHSAYAALEESR
jgi:hypothetical protein